MEKRSFASILRASEAERFHFVLPTVENLLYRGTKIQGRMEISVLVYLCAVPAIMNYHVVYIASDRPDAICDGKEQIGS